MGATGLVLKLHFLTEIKRLEEKMRVFGGTARDLDPYRSSVPLILEFRFPFSRL